MMNAIFVFGSNLEGQHGGGAAAHAYKSHGAKMGVGVGLTGNAYALPTMSKSRDRLSQTLTIAEISRYADQFIAYAKAHPEDTFMMTCVGCGIAGLNHTDVAPLFKDAPVNVMMPRPWHGILFGKDTPERESFAF